MPMEAPVLVKDEKYEGQYVALKSFSDNTVVASGRTPLSVMKKARAAGVRNPVVILVPHRDVVQIY
jgi:hypothetical protein